GSAVTGERLVRRDEDEVAHSRSDGVGLLAAQSRSALADIVFAEVAERRDSAHFSVDRNITTELPPHEPAINLINQRVERGIARLAPARKNRSRSRSMSYKSAHACWTLSK